MNSNLKIGRITGVLLLFVFISGIIIFQVLQGPVLFSDNYLTLTSENSNRIIGSVVLGIFSGLTTIGIAVLLLPVFKRYGPGLAYLYFGFCILNFVAILIDATSVLSMLELSKSYLENEDSSSFKILNTLLYQRHWWTHYLYLLISCFPVFAFYYALYRYKLVPVILSVFGILAVLLMFIEILFSIFGHGISMNMLIPIGLIQLTLPIWLIAKGLRESKTRERAVPKD